MNTDGPLFAFLVVVVPWMLGALAVIVIWGEAKQPFPPLTKIGREVPPTAVVAIAWPIAIAAFAVWTVTFGAYRFALRMHRRLRRPKDVLPAKVRQ